MEVHRVLKHGLLEAVYEECLSLELQAHKITNKRQQEILIYYKERLLDKKYKMDIVVDDIIIELKSKSKITAAHRAQLCNYLRLTQKPIGILVNFGSTTLQGERWAYDKDTNDCFLLDKNMQPLPTHDVLMTEDDIYDEEKINE